MGLSYTAVMNARMYQRYLDYAERYSYFKRPGMTKLAYDEWLPLENELTELLSKTPKTQTELTRERELRKLIMRD